MSPMEDRKPSIKCPCGQSIPVTDEQLFKDVTCPSCGKTVLSAPASAKAEGASGPKTDPFAPKGDTTRGSGTPSTARKTPLFAKDGPLPDPIPGYTFQKRLGQGGMGEVFLAKQESLDRLVAIKLLPPDLAKDEGYVESFMRE